MSNDKEIPDPAGIAKTEHQGQGLQPQPVVQMQQQQPTRLNRTTIIGSHAIAPTNAGYPSCEL